MRASLEVRIRRASDTASSYLLDVDMEDLVSVIPMLKTWGIEGEDDLELSGQFVVANPDKNSYFEVVVSDAQ